MSKTIDNKELNSAIESLTRKTNTVSSSDGLVTLVFSGMCEYKDIKINGFLEDINKKELEKAIIEVLNLSKVTTSQDVVSLLLDFASEAQPEEDDCVTVENVS